MLRVSINGCIASKGFGCKLFAGSFPTLINYLSPLRSQSTSSKLCGACRGSIPELDTIEQLFKERNLRQLTSKSDCKYIKSFQFKKPEDCELVNRIETVAAEALRSYPDVVRMGSFRTVFLEALNQIPGGLFGDFTGDHGKQMHSFIYSCYNQGLMDKIGSVIDIGGQNSSTVKQVSTIFGDYQLPSLIVDPNLITPALSPQEENVYFVVDDALSFFSSDTYDTDVKICNTETPSLFIMNNLLNVLKAKDGWTTLESIWNRVRPGDYLAICGLTPEQLESHKLKRLHEDDGIVEYKDASGNFYKSAISSSFYDYLVQKLQGANLVIEETFRFPIKPEPMHIKSRRSLTVRKMS